VDLGRPFLTTKKYRKEQKTGSISQSSISQYCNTFAISLLSLLVFLLLCSRQRLCHIVPVAVQSLPTTEKSVVFVLTLILSFSNLYPFLFRNAAA
jgi:hypothetical protein